MCGSLELFNSSKKMTRGGAVRAAIGPTDVSVTHTQLFLNLYSSSSVDCIFLWCFAVL
jgi:hypothetical protein